MCIAHRTLPQALLKDHCYQTFVSFVIFIVIHSPFSVTYVKTWNENVNPHGQLEQILFYSIYFSI